MTEPMKHALVTLADLVGKPLPAKLQAYGFTEEHDIPGVMRDYHVLRGTLTMPARVITDQAGWHYAVQTGVGDVLTAIERLYPKRLKYPVYRPEVGEGYRDRMSWLTPTGELASILGMPLRAADLSKWWISGLEIYPSGIRMVMTHGLHQLLIGWDPKEDVIYSYEVGEVTRPTHSRLNVNMLALEPLADDTPSIGKFTQVGEFSIFTDNDTAVAILDRVREAAKRHDEDSGTIPPYASVQTYEGRQDITLSAVVREYGKQVVNIDSLLWG